MIRHKDAKAERQAEIGHVKHAKVELDSMVQKLTLEIAFKNVDLTSI